MYFACNVSFASLPLFVPTIISEIGSFGTLRANGLSSPPYLVTFVLIIFVSLLSDRLQLRGPFVSFFGFVSAVGFILLACTEDAAPRYLGVYLAITIFVCIALMLPLVSNMHSTESKRVGGWIILGTIGQCGPLVGTNLFPPDEAPFYRKGSLISMAFSLLVGVAAAVLSLLLHLENRRLDTVAEVDVTDEERHNRKEIRVPKGFRYII